MEGRVDRHAASSFPRRWSRFCDGGKHNNNQEVFFFFSSTYSILT